MQLDLQRHKIRQPIKRKDILCLLAHIYRSFLQWRFCCLAPHLPIPQKGQPLLSITAFPVWIIKSYILLFIPPMTALMKRLPYFSMTGSGRLTAFEKEYKDGRMTIIIRQNMNIVWKNTYTVSSNHFSVKRIDTDGHILFRIHVGERILVGEIDSRDRWIMTEPRKNPRDDTVIPLAVEGTSGQP